MDVTPTPKMFEFMQKFTDAVIGEEPLAVESSTAANNRRAARVECMSSLHKLVHLAMREGAARAMNPRRTEMGRIQLPSIDQIKGVGNG